MLRILSILWFLLVSTLSPVQALTLNGEYTVVSSATNLSGNTWRFDYSITNNTQGVAWFVPTGLSGLHLAIPKSATVLEATTPATYAPGGFWDVVVDNDYSAHIGMALPNTYVNSLSADFFWVSWWSNYPAAVYPIGTTADFSVTLNNVTVGSGAALVTSYWEWSSPAIATYEVGAPWGQYSFYGTTLLAPTAVPEPAPVLLMLAALAAMLLFRSCKSMSF